MIFYITFPWESPSFSIYTGVSPFVSMIFEFSSVLFQFRGFHGISWPSRHVNDGFETVNQGALESSRGRYIDDFAVEANVLVHLGGDDETSPQLARRGSVVGDSDDLRWAQGMIMINSINCHASYWWKVRLVYWWTLRISWAHYTIAIHSPF